MGDGAGGGVCGWVCASGQVVGWFVKRLESHVTSFGEGDSGEGRRPTSDPGTQGRQDRRPPHSLSNGSGELLHGGTGDVGGRLWATSGSYRLEHMRDDFTLVDSIVSTTNSSHDSERPLIDPNTVYKVGHSFLRLPPKKKEN